MDLGNVLKTVLDEFKGIASTDTIIGKPIEAGNSIIIPVSKVSLGFAGGGGGGSSKDGDKGCGSGTGTGGGASVEPVAFIVVTDGKVSIQKIKGGELALGDLLEKVPGIVSKFIKKKPDEKKDKE